MTRTGVFATEKEIKILKDSLDVPYIRIVGYWTESPQEIAHKFAIAHGLPEITGYYVCDLRNGEFLKE